MSLFGCNKQIISANSTYPPGRCIFRDLSACGDQVSKYICNNHAHLFQLVYKKANYTNGDNEQWSRVNTYIRTQYNFSLPLFKDFEGRIIMTDVHNFTTNVCQNHPNIDVTRLADLICCYLGMSASENNCKLGGWLDDSSIIARDENDRLRYIRNLPLLHRYLFHHSLPSITRNSADNSQTYLVDNVTLTYRPDNSSYNFITPKKDILLKYTNHPNCIATPLVLSGIQDVSHRQHDVLIRPMRMNDISC